LTALRRQDNLADRMRSSWSEENERRQHWGAAWIARTGLTAAEHDIFDCPGVQAAPCAIFGALVRPGDLVVSPSLSHPGVKVLAAQYSTKILELPIDDGLIVPETLEEICREQSPRRRASPRRRWPTWRGIGSNRRQPTS
jgi:DNA-binding transcriptional MocR family regulator